MKLCRNGLHDVDLPGGLAASGDCRPCRHAADARYDATPKGRARNARYAAAPKGRARTARYAAAPKGRAAQARFDRERRARRSAEELRAMPRSYLGGCYGHQLTRVERLRVMAEQTVSPAEAAIARQKLELYVG